MFSRGLRDSYVHTYARSLKTFINFLVKEKYINNPNHIPMPKVAEKEFLVYSETQVRNILNACKDKRKKAFILFMLDSGLRNAEVRNLNWGELDIQSVIVRILNGKGRKFRIVLIGINTRRALLKYRAVLDNTMDKPVFQTMSGARFTESGSHSWRMRLNKRAKIHITPHALRRTFATLSIRSGMNVFQLQALLGHASLEMTRHYVHLLHDEVIEAHRKYGPIDNIISLSI